jgi:N-acetylglucosaminyldiphosphoundecaprenol N-acetyl-beta-D-mannosaminyltransferase
MTASISRPIAARSELLPACRAGSRERTASRRDSQFAHEHADVLGVRISAVDMDLSVDLADGWIRAGKPGYVCVTGVHGVMEAQRDPELLSTFNRAAISLPDGMPMTWIGRLQGFERMDRVFGPDFMAVMCRLSVERGYRIFLYGGKPGVAELLSETLQRRFPGLQVVGTYTPPFRSLTEEEEAELIAQVAKAQPHILWVGVSTPKQERFMAHYAGRLQVPLLVGVGAAFDYHTGSLRDCSRWIKRAGLQWLHRLLQEPRRLWKRYLVNNPAFVWHITWQLLGFRKYPSHRDAPPRETPPTTSRLAPAEEQAQP